MCNECIGVLQSATCGWGEALPGDGLPLLPLIQLPHGVIPHGPPLLRRGGGACGGRAWGGDRPQGLVIHRARHAAHTAGTNHAVAGQRTVALRVLGHQLGPMTGHVPG